MFEVTKDGGTRDGGTGLANLYRTGSNITYAGGGEGGEWGTLTRSTTHNGFAGGGGIGTTTANTQYGTNGATDGEANKGAGGGGRGGNNDANMEAGGNGGSGIVVIRYAV